MKRNRLAGGILALLICLLLFLPAAAAAETAADVQKIEVVFGQLGNDGAVQRLFIVNHFDVPAPAVFKDYGDYVSISRLTDLGEIVVTDDGYEITSDAGRFYYQGELSGRDLPWQFEVSAAVDGTAVPMAELAGKTGELALSVSVKKQDAYRVFNDFYALQITVSLPFEKAIHVASDTGQIALTGDANAVTFMSLPGLEDTFTVTASVQDFAMPGIQIAAVPLNYDIDLESLLAADETFDVDALFAAVTALSDGGSALIESAAELAGGFDELAGGLAELGSAGAALAEGARTLRFGITDFRSGVSSYLDGVGEAADAAALISDGTAALGAGLTTLADESDALKEGAEAISSGLTSLSDGIRGQDFSGLTTLTDGTEDFAAGLTALNDGLTAFAGGLELLAGEGENLVTSLKDVPRTAPPAEDADVFAARFGLSAAAAAREPYASMLITMAAQSTALNQQVQALIDLKSGLTEFVQGLDTLTASLDPLQSGVTDIVTNFESLKSGLDGLTEQLGGITQLRIAVSMLAGGQANFVDGLALYLDGVQEAADGVAGEEGLASGMAALADGLELLHTEGGALKTGAGDLRIGSRRLEDGVRQYTDGVAAAADGTTAFGEGLDQYLDGVGQLASGLNEFNAAATTLQDDLQGMVETELRRILGSDFVPVSFASDQNEAIRAVQFVLMTNAIEIGD